MLKNSFQIRLIALLLLLILISFLVTAVIIYGNMKNTLYDNAVEKGVEIITADTRSLETYLAYVRKSATSLYFNTYIYELTLKNGLDNYQEADILAFMRSMYDISGGVEQIYFNLFNSNSIFILNKIGLGRFANGSKVEIPKNVPPFRVYVENPHSMNSYGTTAAYELDKVVCSLHWNIYNAPVNKILGTISFDIDISRLNKFFENSYNDAEYFCIMDQTAGYVVKNSDILSTEDVWSAINSCDDKKWAEINNENFSGIVFATKIENLGLNWYIVKYTPFSQLYRSANSTLLFTIIVLLSTFILCAASCVIVLSHVMKPIRDIRRYVLAVDTGGLKNNINDYVSYRGNDEIGMLIKHLERMINTVNNMFETQMRLARAQRSAEARMLLSQINPHFIGNTLQSIGSLALEKGQKGVYALICKLGAMMQYSMNLDKRSIILAEEFNHVQNFLDLQNHRYAGRVKSELNLSKAAANIEVPKLILQPIVENSFRHGNITRGEIAFIRIDAEINNDTLQIVIQDNGKGMSQTDMQAMNQRLQRAKPDEITDNIGLANIICRLRLMYGNTANILVKPSAKCGLTVILNIPLNLPVSNE